VYIINEWLWRDLYSGCICFFYHFFYFLEDTGLLDPNNALDIYALHQCFLPVIQSQLNIFKDGWAHHSLRTERHRTPYQLWFLGLNDVRTHRPDLTAASSIDEEIDDNYGVDWDGPLPFGDDNIVNLDNPRDVLSDSQRNMLIQQLRIPHHDVLTEESMIHCYTIAKVFVRVVANN
jgi:hypothetical protein